MLEVKLSGERLVAGPAPMGPGLAQPACTTWYTVRRELGGTRRLWRSHPRQRKLFLATRNVTFLAGNELELVCEIETFQLDFTTTQGLGLPEFTVQPPDLLPNPSDDFITSLKITHKSWSQN